MSKTLINNAGDSFKSIEYKNIANKEWIFIWNQNIKKINRIALIQEKNAIKQNQINKKGALNYLLYKRIDHNFNLKSYKWLSNLQFQLIKGGHAKIVPGDLHVDFLVLNDGVKNLYKELKKEIDKIKIKNVNFRNILLKDTFDKTTALHKIIPFLQKVNSKRNIKIIKKKI